MYQPITSLNIADFPRIFSEKLPHLTTTLNFGELSGPPYSGGGSDSESDQVKSLMELQQHQATAGLTGGYGLYRNPYSNPSGSPAESGPPGFPGRGGHLGGYPGFPPMPGQNSYPGYPSLYPGSQSPGREGMLMKSTV